MDFSGLLTFIGLVIAAYSIMPEHSKLSVRVFVGKWTWFLGFIILCLCVHLIYISRKLSIDDLYNPHSQQFGAIDFEFIAFAFIVGFSLFVILRLKYAKIRPSNIKTYRDLIEELSFQKEYFLLANSLDRNLDRLFLYSRQRTLVQGFLDWCLDTLKPNNLSEAELRFGAILSIVSFVSLLGDKVETPPESTDPLRKISHKVNDFYKHFYIRLYKIIKWLFFDKSVSRYADEILGKFIYQRDFAEYLVSKKPKLAIRLLENKSRNNDQSPHILIEAFMADSKSLLYSEVYKNLGGDTPLLSSLIGDLSKAEDLNVYRPIGEFNIQYLKDQSRLKDDELQYEADVRFEEHLKLKNPIYAGIFFFDALVRRAIEQRFAWHMWLYYLSYWIEGIVENAKSEYWGRQTEFPNRYAYLLYELVSHQKSWIRDYIGKDMIEVDNLEKHENENVFKCICDSLSRGVASILSSDQIPYQFKIYIAEMIWGLVLDLKSSQFEDEQRLGDYLVLSLKRQFSFSKHRYGVSNIIYETYRDTLRSIDQHRYSYDLYKEIKDDWDRFDYENPPFGL
jgi:hypothetical protein